MIRGKRLATLALAAVALSGCTDWAGYDLDYAWGYIPALSTLRGSVALDPYEAPMLPPENAVPAISPMGEVPAHFTQSQLDSVGATLTNPYGASPAPEVLARGKALFESQCSVCHGPAGDGAGSTVTGAGKFPPPPSLLTPLASGYTPGYIYAIIVAGRGLMPPYGERLTHNDRWAVVSYVRQLQAAPTSADTAAAPGD